MAHVCKFCQSTDTQTFVDLGPSPLANSFIKASDLGKEEKFYPLHTKVCADCLLVQVEEQIDPTGIFSDYLYFSSFSTSWLLHAKAFCDIACERFDISPRSRVIEVASNDGYLLQYFQRKGIECLGIEPANNVAEAARKKNINTIADFLTPSLAAELSERGQQADLLIANNVLAHVPDIHGFVASLRMLLKPAGVLSIEVPHLLSLMEESQFDTIYHEHYYYYSVLTLSKIMTCCELEIFDIQKISTHGGSLRLYVHHTSDTSVSISDSVEKILDEEREHGLENPATYSEFCHKVYRVKKQLLEFLFKAKAEGARVAAYGAPAKGNTLLNYCRIGTDLIYATADLNDNKQNLFLPGSRIPILSPQALARTNPDYVLILPWNLKNEIMCQLRDSGMNKVKFVTVVPDLEIVREN